jgi:hypothetical protein
MLKYIYLIIICFAPLCSFAGEFNSIPKIYAASEQRSIPGISSEEFTEDAYVGEYSFG